MIAMMKGPQTYAFGGAPALGSPVPGSKPEGDRDGAVMHLVVMKAVDHSDLLQGLSAPSRDFH